MSVTEYLEHARECAALAERKTGEEKTRLLALAESWLKLAEQAAADATHQRRTNAEGARKPSPDGGRA